MARSFTAACKEFFGMKPGQTLQDFGKKLKALSFEEKKEIAEGLRQVGVDCEDPVPAK